MRKMKKIKSYYKEDNLATKKWGKSLFPDYEVCKIVYVKEFIKEEI